MPDTRATVAAQAAIDAHSASFRLEQSDTEVQVWHLIASLLDYCDAQSPRLEFDSLVADIRENYRAQRDNGGESA